ncbi:MAG: alanine racemase [Actinobacteria bacterium]|nr:alanine racemase [Actinomycetota bacterium]
MKLVHKSSLQRSFFRPAWAEVSLSAARHNASLLSRLVAPARLCAVVKADAYGHGATAMAVAFLEGGASCLAVALVEEGIQLREAGIDAPILILSEPPREAMAEVMRFDLTPTLYTREGIIAAQEAASKLYPLEHKGVHLKVDTGMHRVGARPVDVTALAKEVQASDNLFLEGLWTHLAKAEDRESSLTRRQLEVFESTRAELASTGMFPSKLHVANSAGALVHPASRYSMVRCGLSLYGYYPAPWISKEFSRLSNGDALQPVMSLKARVSYVHEVEAGEGISYGHLYHVSKRSRIAVVPLGYADGVSRKLSAGIGEALLNGRRRPFAGAVTMDQLMLDCGEDTQIREGDEVVLLGEQGGEQIWADHWAELTGSIVYEVLCGIGPRVPRNYLD